MNLKKITQKDSNGNILSFEFDIPKANVPPVDSIPEYDHPGDPRGSDTVPAWLTPGENVVNAEASRIPGNQELIDYMNNQGRAIQAQQGGSIPTYAAGGGALFESHYGKGSTLTDTHIGKDFYNHFGPMYAAEGTRPAADTSWIGGILDALRFTESSDYTDPADMISTAGALGPYQIMPSNLGLMPKKDKAGKIIPGEFYNVGAAGYNTPVITEEEVWDEDKARAWAEKYLTGLQLAFPEWSPTEVLRAYNWGPGNVKDYLNEEITFEQMPQEAKDYVGKVFKHYKRLTGKEFSPTDSNAPAPTLIEDGGIVEPVPSVGEGFVIPEHTIPSDDGMEFVPPQEGSNDFPSLNMPRYPEIINRKEDTLRKIKLNLDLQKLFKENPNLDPYYKSKEFKQKVLTEAMYNPEILNDVGSLLTGAPKKELLTEQTIRELINKNNPNLKTELDWKNAYKDGRGSDFEESVPELNEPLINTIKGPDTDPNAPEVNPANYLFTSGAGINVPGAGETLIPELNEPLINTIKGPDTDPNAPEVNPANYDIPKPEENFDYAAAQLKHLQKTHDLKNRDVWESENIESILESDYVAGNIETEEEFDEKLRFANEIKQNKENRVLNHWERVENNAKKEEVVEKKNKTLELFERLERTNNPKLKEAIEKEIEKTETEIKNLNESIVKNVDDMGWSTNIDTEAKKEKAKTEAEYKDIFKEGRGNERLNKLFENLNQEGAGNVTQTEAEVEAKYKEVFKEGRGNKKLREDLKLPKENKVIGFFKSLLGDLWNTDEFKRAAVHYLGSRVLGYDHNASLKYSVKKFMTNYDTEKATRAANIKSWAGKYTPASLELYKESGNLSDLIPVGAKIFRQGTFQDFHGMVNGKHVTVKAEKVHVGTGDSKNVKWMLPNGKFLDTSKMSLNAYDVPKTKEYEDRVDKQRKYINSQLTTLRNQIGKRGSGENIDYATNINVDTAAGVSVEWALANGVDLVRLPGLVDLAYKAMVSDSGRADGKPSDIEGYLNDVIIKQTTNEDRLFKNEEGTPMSAELFQIMTQNIEHILESTGQPSDFTGISNYINLAAQVWSGTNQLKDGTLDPDNLTQKERDEWNAKASSGKGADTTGFYEWLQNEMAKEKG